MASLVSFPTNNELSHQVSSYMRRRFYFLACPGSMPTAPPIPLDLPVDLSIGMHQMAATLVTAYHNRNTGVDLVRLSESLAAMEPGTNVEREKVFVMKISPAFSGLVDKPTIILGEGGTVALWYLPGALAQPMQVGS
ncbi:hypothetical protein SCLCIDRAFT_28492 [Scleroderma citrinum Foug A]|uniref:Uncharacterized protein n=1 Tax=Scleroderma citrinum Foug A TaxID=1036808 RepID=A0A0C2ZZJ0_9AGAM|nr:hypothetical protein SCLCIDRAFT_28492 [Scleroderma citrinum Foug A]